MNRYDTFIVDVEGQNHQVGREAQLVTDTKYGRILGHDFVTSDSYLALVKGALAYMRQPVIDMLVLGLPVNVYERLTPVLKKRIKGTHDDRPSQAVMWGDKRKEAFRSALSSINLRGTRVGFQIS